jgi:hypothetical protein
MNTAELIRFESKVELIPGIECHIWTARCDDDGYGTLKVGGKTLRAHRLSYEHFIGPIGENHVLHKCDVPSCVNPNHLFLGGHAANVADKVAKSRQAKGKKARAKKRTKLTNDQVIKIRELAVSGHTQRSIADKFGVTQANISLIISKKNWAYL